MSHYVAMIVRKSDERAHLICREYDETDDEEANAIISSFIDGNNSCDCNRALLCGDGDVPCGDGVQYSVPWIEFDPPEMYPDGHNNRVGIDQ